MLGKCAVCLCLHLSLSLSPCVFFCLLKIQTAASWICINIPTSQRPDHWSLLSRGRRASPGFWYGICSQFHPLCSSTIVLLPKVFPFISSWVFFFLLGSIPLSPQTIVSFIFSPVSISASSRILSGQLLLSSLLPLSILISLIRSFFPGYSPSTPLSTFTLYPADFILSPPISLPLPLPLPPRRQLNRWKTQLSSVLSHPCFLLAFYKTPGHHKAAIYHSRGATPRDTKVSRWS